MSESTAQPTVPPETERIRFRPFREDDVDSVAAMFADPHARRFYPRMDRPGAAEHWIAWNLENYRTFGFGLWVIEHRSSGSFLGDCGLTYQPVEGNSILELGYHLQVAHRGKGYVTEAGRGCIDFAFDEGIAAIVCSIVDPENAPSIAVASRLHASRRTFVNDQGRAMLLFWSGTPPTPGLDPSRRKRGDRGVSRHH